MLASRIALVTGSTSGIGLGIAKKLASQGANLVINGFGEASYISDLCNNLKSTYDVKTYYAAGDMSDPKSIENMMQSINQNFGGVDILVNNAGIQHVEPIDTFPVEMWDKIIAINLSSVFHTTRLALPHMKAQNWGRILNIASVHGLVASSDKSAYVTAKVR